MFGKMDRFVKLDSIFVPVKLIDNKGNYKFHSPYFDVKPPISKVIREKLYKKRLVLCLVLKFSRN